MFFGIYPLVAPTASFIAEDEVEGTTALRVIGLWVTAKVVGELILGVLSVGRGTVEVFVVGGLSKLQ